MKTFMLTAVIGVIAGAIDVLPMIKMKLDKYSIISAFIHYFILPFFVYNTQLFGMPWWLKGAILALMLAVPTIILAAKDDGKSVPPMLLSSVFLGTLIGISGHYLLP